MTFVEGVWFDQAITGRSYADIGIAATVDGSFTLRQADTIAISPGRVPRSMGNVEEERRRAPLDEMVDGRGARPVWALKLQVLREFAQHAGHTRHPSGADYRKSVAGVLS